MISRHWPLCLTVSVCGCVMFGLGLDAVLAVPIREDSGGGALRRRILTVCDLRCTRRRRVSVRHPETARPPPARAAADGVQRNTPPLLQTPRQEGGGRREAAPNPTDHCTVPRHAPLCRHYRPRGAHLPAPPTTRRVSHTYTHTDRETAGGVTLPTSAAGR